MTHRIALSAFGALVGLGLLGVFVRDSLSGASLVWPAVAAATSAAAVHTLVRDVRDARRRAR
ncbi:MULTISPECIES: hypothetical protein [unclassified Streptomyces]|uniref:hypothetical protein n=1 Tax=unclassified Streptomyces TaxID=2593676 RepID=UPI00382D6C30